MNRRQPADQGRISSVREDLVFGGTIRTAAADQARSASTRSRKQNSSCSGRISGYFSSLLEFW